MDVYDMLLYEMNLEDTQEAFIEQGREDGQKEEQKSVVLKALAEGLSIESVHRITKLDIETIKQLRSVQV
jgi:predicted transposase YdaD